MSDEKSGALYQDSVLRITPDALIFKHFYFLCGARSVKWHNIESVEIKTPTLQTGKWRLLGTRSLLARIVFPLDEKRDGCDMIFALKLKGNDRCIDFAADDFHKVEAILRRNNIVVHREKPTSTHSKFSSFA